MAIQLPESSQASLKESLSRFRTRAFDRYPESVYAVHSWTQAVNSAPFKQDVTAEDAKVGSLAILLRDLNVWAGEDPQEQVKLPAVAGKVQPRIVVFLGHATATSDSRARKAVKWLEAMVVIAENSDNPWIELSETMDPGLALFLCHGSSRNWLESSDWRDEWSATGKSWAILNGCNSGRQAVEELAYHNAKTLFVRRTGVRQKLLGPSHEAFSDRAIRRNFSDILWKLLTAASFEDLAAGTGIQEELLEQLLVEVGDKCGINCWNRNVR